MPDEPTPTPEPKSPAAAVEPTPVIPVEPAPAFDAKFNRDGLMSSVPEGVDPEKFGKWLDKTADPHVAYKNYSNLEGMKSKGLPNEAWSDEDYANLDAARGVPSEAEAYQFSEETTLGEESANRVREIALEGKYTPAQAQKLAEVVQGLEAQGQEMQAQEEQKNVENMISYLESEWGHPDTNAYQQNFGLVKDFLAVNGIEHDSDASNAIWSGPPQVIKMLHEAALMTDSSILPRVNSGELVTPKSIEGELSRLAGQMNSVEAGSQEFKELNEAYDRKFAQKARMS